MWPIKNFNQLQYYHIDKMDIVYLKDLIISVYKTIRLLLMVTLRGVLQSQQIVGKLIKIDGHFMIYQFQKDV